MIRLIDPSRFIRRRGSAMAGTSAACFLLGLRYRGHRTEMRVSTLPLASNSNSASSSSIVVGDLAFSTGNAKRQESMPAPATTKDSIRRPDGNRRMES